MRRRPRSTRVAERDAHPAGHATSPGGSAAHPAGRARSPARDAADPARDAADPARAPVVVVGFDGSEASRRAVEWAAGECELRQAVLVVLHADHWSPAALALPVAHDEVAMEETVLEEGIRLARRRHPAVTVKGRRVPPPAGESLVAATHEASLLVVGSRGLRHMHQVVLGSVSHYCVAHAHCPVVIVRGDEGGSDTASDPQRSSDPSAAPAPAAPAAPAAPEPVAPAVPAVPSTPSPSDR